MSDKDQRQIGGKASEKEEETGDRGEDDQLWSSFVGEKVIIDTASRYVFLGTLVKRLGGSLILENVDVHDNNESKSTKEVYVMEAAKHGIRVNREKVLVPEHRVLSISKLEDTVLY